MKIVTGFISGPYCSSTTFFGPPCVMKLALILVQQWHIIINFITKTKKNNCISSAGMFIFVGINHWRNVYF